MFYQLGWKLITDLIVLITQYYVVKFTKNRAIQVKMTKNRAMGMILDPIKNRANSKSVLWEAVLQEALLQSPVAKEVEQLINVYKF